MIRKSVMAEIKRNLQNQRMIRKIPGSKGETNEKDTTLKRGLEQHGTAWNSTLLVLLFF